jgi:hypothetical protein
MHCPIYVNSFGVHGLTNVTNRAIVGYVNAFFVTIESDTYERNRNRVMLFGTLVYRTEMVMWTELFERSDKRSSLCCNTHKSSFFLPGASLSEGPTHFMVGREIRSTKIC